VIYRDATESWRRKIKEGALVQETKNRNDNDNGKAAAVNA
jgi:hypothetical protein